MNDIAFIIYLYICTLIPSLIFTMVYNQDQSDKKKLQIQEVIACIFLWFLVVPMLALIGINKLLTRFNLIVTGKE